MTAPPAEQVTPALVVAGSVAAAESLEAHRADLETLLALALTELTAVWDNISAPSPDDTRNALAAALPGLVELYGPAAATLGADWYDDMRDAAGVASRFRAIPAELPAQGQLDALVGWGTQPLWPYEVEVEGDDGFVTVESVEANPEAAASRISAGFQRLVADMDRGTVHGSLARDPQARGWARQTTGLSCDFCKMLASRGAVYSAKTVDFASHNRCDCICTPVFGGDPRPVRAYAPSSKFRSQSQRDENNKRVRMYLATGANSGRTRTAEASLVRDVDAGRSVAQLRATLASLERSLERFDSPGARARIADLRRKIAARS